MKEQMVQGKVWRPRHNSNSITSQQLPVGSRLDSPLLMVLND